MIPFISKCKKMHVRIEVTSRAGGVRGWILMGKDHERVSGTLDMVFIVT
jgi:hypothetical protein